MLTPRSRTDPDSFRDFTSGVANFMALPTHADCRVAYEASDVEAVAALAAVATPARAAPTSAEALRAAVIPRVRRDDIVDLPCSSFLTAFLQTPSER